MSSCFAATELGDLIPGLPEEVARECLIRVGFDQLPTVRRISRQWKEEVESPDYSRLRRAEGLARPVIAMVPAQPEHVVEPGPALKHSSASSAANGGPANKYRMVLLEPVEGRWASLPVLPGPTGSLPLFCQVAAVDGGQGRKRLVVVGGWEWDPESWAPTDSVYVYDFLTGAWRRAALMPGPRRSFFATAAVGGTVYVAGGHDEEKNALRSALAYDPDSDAWTALPDMAEVRDEPRGLCVGGHFVVVGGYPTPAQGRFAGSAKAFDPATSTWSPVREAMLEDGACPRMCCVAPGAESMYMLRDGNLVARDGGASAAWRTVASVPEDARTASTVSSIPDGRVVVIGSGCHGGDQTVYTLRDEAGKPSSWTCAPARAGRLLPRDLITELYLVHRSIRRIRQALIVSGRCDNLISRRGPACRQGLSSRPAASGQKAASSATWACSHARRIREVRMLQDYPVGTPRRMQRDSILLLLNQLELFSPRLLLLF